MRPVFRMRQEDFLEGVAFALKVGKFAITAEAGGEVRLTVVERGTTKVFSVSPDVALNIAKALESIAVCAKFAKDFK